MAERGSRFESTSPPLPRGRRVAVGNAVYHSVGEREEVVRQLGVDYDRASLDIGTAIGVFPYEGSAERVKHHPEWYAWWVAAAAPLFASWAAFKADQLGVSGKPAAGYVAYGERFGTDWAAYVEWQHRLIELRASAAQLGIPLHTPTPAPLPTTIPEDVANLAKRAKDKLVDSGGDLWTLAKVGVYGGLALVGVVAVSSLVSNLKTGKDPAENYLALARRGR